MAVRLVFCPQFSCPQFPLEARAGPAAESASTYLPGLREAETLCMARRGRNMRSRMPWLVGLLSGVLLASALPVSAKTVSMRPLSRAAVEAACTRVGGAAYGTREADTEYGCRARNSSVACAPDGTCFGYVPDLVRLPANSLDAVLGVVDSGKPVKIAPVDDRIVPLVQP
jgi:hypothetical protein